MPLNDRGDFRWKQALCAGTITDVIVTPPKQNKVRSTNTYKVKFDSNILEAKEFSANGLTSLDEMEGFVEAPALAGIYIPQEEKQSEKEDEEGDDGSDNEKEDEEEDDESNTNDESSLGDAFVDIEDDMEEQQEEKAELDEEDEEGKSEYKEGDSTLCGENNWTLKAAGVLIDIHSERGTQK